MANEKITRETAEELRDILFLLNNGSEYHVVSEKKNDDEEEERLKIHDTALQSFGYSGDKTEKILSLLKYKGYIDCNNELTPEGLEYLRQEAIEIEQQALAEKESKKADVEYKLKIATGILALITTIVTTILAIYNAFQS